MINQGPEIKVTLTALVGGAGSRFLSMSNIPYQNATWKSLTGVSRIIQGPQPTQVSSALWALRTLRHVHSCYSLQWIQTGSLLSIFITIPSGSVLAGFCNENPAQSTLWHAASSLKIVQWHTAIITHINTLHCAVWRFVPVAWLIPPLGTWWDGRKELTFPKRQSSAPGPARAPGSPAAAAAVPSITPAESWHQPPCSLPDPKFTGVQEGYFGSSWARRCCLRRMFKKKKKPKT